MNTTDKIIKEFREKFGYIGNKGVQCDEITIKNLEYFISKALKQAEEDTLKEVLSLIKDLDKQAEKGDLVGLQDLEEVLFSWLSNLKEK